MICEGTRARDEGGTWEDEVHRNALEVARGTGGLVIADFGPRNVERLLVFLDIAERTGRRLVVTVKDAYLLEAMRPVDPGVPDLAMSSVYVYDEAKGGSLSAWEKGIRKRCASTMVTAGEVHRNQSHYILCFSFYEINELINIDPEPNAGVYIFSTSEAYTEEQRLDLFRLRNWLKHFKIAFRGDPDDPAEKNMFHASGHASGAELLEMIRRIKPRRLIPIHTEDPVYFKAELEDSGVEVILPSEGRTVLW